MLNRFKAYLKDKRLFTKNDKMLLAVSGGIDSVVMTELFDLAGYKFAIAHCNFGLRGDESGDDERFVEALAQRKKVRFFVRKFETTKYANSKKISKQMAARELRFNWFEELIKEFGFTYYATAHHLDDQIETLFINIFRGCGLSGLHGILPKQGNLLHPLLFCYRNEIENFAKINRLKYREDSSNITTDYTRNKIRHNLIPVIKKIKTDYAEIINNNISRWQQVEEIYKQHVNNISKDLLLIDNRTVQIRIDDLLKLHPLETYLFEFISPYNFNISDVKDIIKSLNSTSGKQFLSSSHRIIKDRKFLIIEEMVKDNIHSQKDYFITANENLIDTPLKLKLNRFNKPIEFTFNSNSSIALLDRQKLEFPLKIRKWNRGDYFYPLGMKNKKLVSDFFIDNKFTISEKEVTWLLTSANQIVWIMGHRIDNRFKITDKTKVIYKIEALC